MQFEEEIQLKDHLKTMAGMLAFSATLAISFSIWIASLVASSYSGFLQPVSPWRCLFSVFTSWTVATRAMRNKSIDHSGAFAGMLAGTVLSMANLSFLSSLLAFFVTSAKIQQWKAQMSQTTHTKYKGAQTNALQMLHIAGIPTELAVLYMMEMGPCEAPLDFTKQYTATWLSLALLGTVASNTGNTWASELGPVLSKLPPRLITSWKEVPIGTHGGVTSVGLLASFLGGMTVGVTYFITQLLFVHDLKTAAPQWPVVMYGAVAGIMGSLLRSYLGARAQYSAYEPKTGEVVSYESRTTKRISGKPVLESSIASLISSIVIAWLLPGIAVSLWPEH